MRDTTKLIADLRYWQERSKSKGELFKAAADEIESRQRLDAEQREVSDERAQEGK
jgi:hypothetical protein